MNQDELEEIGKFDDIDQLDEHSRWAFKMNIQDEHSVWKFKMNIQDEHSRWTS